MNSEFNKVSTAKNIDVGLRTFMQRVFGMMGLGLGVTAFMSYLVFSTPSLYIPLLTSPLRWVFLLATIAIPLGLGAGIHKLKAATASMLFWVYSALMGVSLAPIFMLYTGESIARVFLISSCLFGSMSLYGYATKRDLSSMASFMVMGLWGLILASIVNLFVGSSAFQMALSVISVIIFTGLTAWDMQRIRSFYHSGMNSELSQKASTLGALSLYLNFINIFLALLRLFGDRR